MSTTKKEELQNIEERNDQEPQTRALRNIWKAVRRSWNFRGHDVVI